MTDVHNRLAMFEEMEEVLGALGAVIWRIQRGVCLDLEDQELMTEQLDKTVKHVDTIRERLGLRND